MLYLNKNDAFFFFFLVFESAKNKILKKKMNFALRYSILFLSLICSIFILDIKSKNSFPFANKKKNLNFKKNK